MIYKIIIGSVLAIIYILIFSGTVDWFSAFNQTQKGILSGSPKYLIKAQSGLAFIYLMAIASIYFIAFPQDETRSTALGFYLAIIVFISLFSFY